MKWLLILVLTCVVLFGCDANDMTQIKEYSAQAESYVETADSLIVKLQVELGKAELVLADAPDDDAIKDIVSKLRVAIDIVSGKREALKESIIVWNEMIADVEDGGTGDILTVGGSGVTAVGGWLPPPWGTAVGGIGAILTTLGGYLATKNTGKLKKESAISTDLIESVGVLLNSRYKSTAKKYKVILSDNQTPETKAKVKEWKNLSG